MFRRLRILVLAVLFALPAVSATAQSANAPYEKQLLRLAEVLGSIHYLRNVCGEKSNQWREQMEELLVTENPSPERRTRLVASFNHGYRSFQSSYAHCTASAVEAIRRYMKEGENLTGEIASRYGN